jgi:hypothetical protein
VETQVDPIAQLVLPNVKQPLSHLHLINAVLLELNASHPMDLAFAVDHTLAGASTPSLESSSLAAVILAT